MILACKNISKSFGSTEILKDISFHINEKEKAAIIGINGAGKSTLFKIIMGELSPDGGDITFAKGIEVGYLSQHQLLDSNHTIYEELLTVKKDVIQLDQSIRKLEEDMKHANKLELEKMLATYTRLTHEYELKNGYAYKSEVTGILIGLGFKQEEFGKSVSTLSGGQKTRISLGKLLLSTPELILLDEPTNHLDLESIAWLENYLLNYNGAVVVIAHDRYFLNKVVSKVVEIEHGKSTMYEGNYTSFSQKKALQREALLKQYFNQQKEIKHQEEVIAKLRSFNREKSIKRAESREKMLDKIDRIEKPITEEAKMSFVLEPHVTSGNDVLTIKGLKKSFGPLNLFDNLDFDIKRGERISIIGNNGTGKTTILKIINTIIPSDGGDIKYGSKVNIGYYDQEHNVLSPEKTLFDELQDSYPHLDNTAIRNILAAFLFTNDDVFKRIKDISGGERGRVSLAKLMLSEANFLILDEPTNHLDIISKEILENALNNYAGTILYVSHDRYFINQTATRILDLTQKKMLNYIGNYDYYLEKKETMEAIHLFSSNDTTTSLEGDTKLDWKQQKEEQSRLRKKQSELAKIEASITKFEARDREIDLLLSDESIYTNVTKLMELNQEKAEIEQTLLELMTSWEKLSE